MPESPSARGQGPAALAALAAVAAGGVVGSLARWGVALALPTAPGGFPWATFAVNVLGSLLMGVLVVVAAARTTHPLARPFLGVGVLGGFTTFSTFAVDADLLLAGGHGATALVYLAGTVVAAVGAAALGSVLARRMTA